MVANPPSTPVSTMPVPIWATTIAVKPMVKPARIQGTKPSLIFPHPPTNQSIPKPIIVEMMGINLENTRAEVARGVPVISEKITSGAPNNA